MKLTTFIAAAKAVKLPAGNYLLKSKKTGVIFWFMVSLNYDATVREVHKPPPGYKGIDSATKLTTTHEEFDFYYHFHLPNNRKWHKKLIAATKEKK